MGPWNSNGEWSQASYSNSLAAFLYIELISNIWFTVEIVIRMLVCPDIGRFIRSSNNLIDMMATLIFYVGMVMEFFGTGSETMKAVVNFLGITFILRLFKLSDHSAGLKIIIYTFKASIAELVLLVFFMCLGLVIFASKFFIILLM